MLGAAYDAYAASYDNRPLDGLVGIPEFRSELVSQATGRILEVAAGTGLNGPYYVFESVVLTDISPLMLAVASDKGFDTVVADAASLPFGDDEFDSVVSTFSMCVFDEPEAVLREMRRVLKPDGRLYLLENTRPDAFAFIYDLPFAAAFSKGCRQNRDVPSLLADFTILQQRSYLNGFFKAFVAKP